MRWCLLMPYPTLRTLQLVWKGTSRMGCGSSTVDGITASDGYVGTCKAIVCFFMDPGNYYGDDQWRANGEARHVVLAGPVCTGAGTWPAGYLKTGQCTYGRAEDWCRHVALATSGYMPAYALHQHHSSWSTCVLPTKESGVKPRGSADIGLALPTERGLLPSSPAPSHPSLQSSPRAASLPAAPWRPHAARPLCPRRRALPLPAPVPRTPAAHRPVRLPVPPAPSRPTPRARRNPARRPRAHPAPARPVPVRHRLLLPRCWVSDEGGLRFCITAAK